MICWNCFHQTLPFQLRLLSILRRYHSTPRCTFRSAQAVVTSLYAVQPESCLSDSMGTSGQFLVPNAVAAIHPLFVGIPLGAFISPE